MTCSWTDSDHSDIEPIADAIALFRAFVADDFTGAKAVLNHTPCAQCLASNTVPLGLSMVGPRDVATVARVTAQLDWWTAELARLREAAG